MKLIDLVVLMIVCSIFAFALGYHEGMRDRLPERPTAGERKSHFTKTVYRQNDIWCEGHKRWCK